jgi:DNA-binding winged helix-turn-helix (wHTH) protein
LPRYRFDAFLLSPRRRALLRDGHEQPLIPRYFDLLLFLVERRGDAIHRRDIFDGVWTDVVVSDAALSQAIRTIRRTLGDDSREPRFVRTVSRHGYSFVHPGVIEEPDEGPWPTAGVDVGAGPSLDQSTARADTIEPLLERLTQPPRDASDTEDLRDAAEQLHVLDTAEALRRLGARLGHARARALLRDARWDVPGAGPVPLVGAPGALTAVWYLVVLRVRRAARLALARSAAASAGGALAGACAGAAGGGLLAFVPGGTAPPQAVPVLGAVGAAAGALGGAGVGTGIALAESAVRSQRMLALVTGGAIGGGAVGLFVQWLSQWTLAVLVGLVPTIGGATEGLTLGAAAALGYGLGTAGVTGGLAAPRGRRRLTVVMLTATACGLAALALALTGHSLVGGTLHAIAHASAGSQPLLTPLAHLVGEPDFGPVTAAVLGTGEGTAFGLGLALGLTRRP